MPPPKREVLRRRSKIPEMAMIMGRHCLGDKVAPMKGQDPKTLSSLCQKSKLEMRISTPALCEKHF